MNIESDIDSDYDCSAAEFARLVGRDPALVSRWKRAGKLVLTPEGRILYRASCDALADALHPGRGGRRSGSAPAPSIASRPDPVANHDDDDLMALRYALKFAAALDIAAGGDGREVSLADLEAGGRHYYTTIRGAEHV